jgi:hypothetical protein
LPFSNYELRTNHLSGSHTVPKGITTLLSVLSNLKIGKRIVLKESKTLASDNYDSGRGTSGINIPEPKKINWTFSSHITENAAFINNKR